MPPARRMVLINRNEKKKLKTNTKKMFEKLACIQESNTENFIFVSLQTSTYFPVTY